MIFFIFYFFSKNDFFIFLFFLLKMNSLVVFKSQLKELMTQLEVISNKKKNKLLYSKSEIIIINDIYLLLTSFLINDEKCHTPLNIVFFTLFLLFLSLFFTHSFTP